MVRTAMTAVVGVYPQSPFEGARNGKVGEVGGGFGEVLDFRGEFLDFVVQGGIFAYDAREFGLLFLGK